MMDRTTKWLACRKLWKPSSVRPTLRWTRRTSVLKSLPEVPAVWRGRIGRMRLFSFEKLSLELLTQATALWFAMTCKQHFELVLGNIGAWSWHADRVSMPLAARPTGKSGPFRLEAG